MANILDEIVAFKRVEIEETRSHRPLEAIIDCLASAPPVRDFVEALRPGDPATMKMIAEVKRASPSARLIRDDFDAVEIARTYQEHGASCISCLTDEKYFQGKLEYLTAIRESVDLPVLRKDFILDRYQIAEARAAGADCVLLIAECLDDRELPDLFEYARELGMNCLVELYEPENLPRVTALNPPLIGVNNRNLKLMKTDLSHSISLLDQIPEGCIFVSESGIHQRADVLRLEEAGIYAMLVGETLMKSANIASKVHELLGTAS